MNVAAPETTETEEPTAPQVSGPGERLKGARIAKGMDLSRIADRLHLTADMVEAIECDDYSELPARVFVRGYVKNYARAVGLPADSVMAQFDAIWPEDDATVRVHKAPRLPADSRPATHWARAVTWLLVIFTLVLFLMWWQGYLGRFTRGLEHKAGHPSEQVKTTALGQPASPTPVTGSGTLPLPGKPPGQAGAAGVSGKAEANTGQSTAAAAASAQHASAVTPGATSGSGTQAATSATLPVQSGVVLSFSSACWVNVHDSSGAFRLVGHMAKGAHKTLGGEPPYKMVLGKASAVSLSVDGKPFDLAPYTKDNVARLTLKP